MKRPPYNLAITLLAAGVISCGSRGEDPNAPAVPTAPVVPAAATPAPPAPKAEGFEKLAGRWLREDGGYVLEIRSISPDGKADASYFNPRPINIARAEAFREGGTLTFFVELQAPNYPGSTYRLAYDPARDILVGTYFQALQKQTFEVLFVRR